MILPAAKCNGVDLRPAVSLAFTFVESTIERTFVKSPHLQASKSSLRGSVGLIFRGSDNLDMLEAVFFSYLNSFIIGTDVWTSTFVFLRFDKIFSRAKQ